MKVRVCMYIQEENATYGYVVREEHFVVHVPERALTYSQRKLLERFVPRESSKKRFQAMLLDADYSIHASEPRGESRYVHFRVSEDMFVMLHVAAARLGETLSEFLRRAALRRVGFATYETQDESD